MKLTKCFTRLFYLSLILIFGCNEINPEGEKEVREFVKQWNNKHTELKSAYLKDDYMDVVTYYGKERTNTQVQQDKILLFEKFPDYAQRIIENEITITKEASTYLVAFTKRVKYNGVEADFTSFLSVISKNNKFRILREGISENSKNRNAPVLPYNRENDVAIVKNKRLYGDFNGDNLSDFASVKSPKIKPTTDTEVKGNETVDCVGECDSVIMFSQVDLEPIVVKGAYQSQLENLKDLNGDGADEIGFWDIKPKSKSLYIFDATNGELLTEPVYINTAIHSNLSLIDVFKKTGPKKISVTHSEEVNGDWVLQSESIVLD
ncbi:hypothetical protein [Winogradskyella ursingii]|uniref:hypothetical protein n=1 Tax=Winogradskyella ursingii TaxID=2686079 RepID=UPI0015CEA72E|nr:hypothetical protein [Winogradskyella ursingii]